ncbi:hypothetical protein ACRAWG_15095 [Methylobacterium sp. P31]
MGLNKAAFVLGQLEKIDESTIEARLIEASNANGYTQKDGIAQVRRTIRSGLEKGRAEPRGRPAGRQSLGVGFSTARRTQSAQSSNEKVSNTLPTWTEPNADGQPRFTAIGRDPIDLLPGEIRRHVYRRDGQAARIKVKTAAGWLNFYRVRRPSDGATGWQARKPGDYQQVPYIGPASVIDPFGPDLADDPLFWPEGEKDVDTLAAVGALAFTSGGASDVPAVCADWIRGRHVIVLTDQDEPGRTCGDRKVALAATVAASVRRVDFPGLEAGGDVTTWFEEHGGTVDELLARALTAEPDGAKRGRSGAAISDQSSRLAADLRPAVRVVAGEVPQAVAETEFAILKAGLPIYGRGGALVRPVVESVPASRGRMTTVARFKPLCTASLADHAARAVRYQRFDGRSRDWITINPPNEVVAALLARDGQWSLPQVAGIITTPTLRPDGTILDKPGYDPATRLYLALDPAFTMPPVPERPDQEDAERALLLLEELLQGFPFVGPIDRAVALSGILTAVVRGALPVAPLHAIRAHTPGSGKSFLVDIASTIATGRRCPVIAAGKSEEETEKRLGALLRDAVPVISIDNINGELGGDALCQMTERPLVRVRILGKSEAPEVECRATVFATGNNLILVGDMTRRTVLCTLDAGLERPELRSFAFSPIDRVLSDRGSYVSAALTVIRAYRTAGAPPVCAPVGSYEDWSANVRAPLIWLGRADPVASMETARDEDPELSAIRELFGHWREHLTLSSGYTANTIIRTACEKGLGSYDQTSAFQAPEFRDLLLQQAGDGGAVSSRRLGKWLAKISGRVVDEHRLEMRVDGSNGNRFSLCPAARAGHAQE